MKKFSGVGRGLFIPPSSADPEVGRASSSGNEDPLSPGPPELVSHQEGEADSEDKSSLESPPSPLPESTEDSCTGAGTSEESTEETPWSSGSDPPDQTLSTKAADDSLQSREPEAVDKSEDQVIPSLGDRGSIESDVSKSELSASRERDKALESDVNVLSAQVSLQETEKSASSIDANAQEEKVEGGNSRNTQEMEKSPGDSPKLTSLEKSEVKPELNENGSVKPKSDEDAKDSQNDAAESESADRKINAEKSKIQIAANLNSSAPTTKSAKTSQDIPLLPSPMKVPGAGILGPAPNAPLLPRGPPSMFPKALPISIPPPPMELRLPPPKVVPKTKEELLQILTEQVGIIQPPEEKGSGDQGKGKTAQPDDQNPKKEIKKQRQQQQQQQHQPGHHWQNPSNMRMQQQGMPNMQNRQPNAGKKPSPQGATKQGLSNLTKDELEKEYQWQKYSVERKIKKVLISLKTSTDEEVIKDMLAIIKSNPSKLASFPWPKEQYVVLEKLIEHAILNKENEESLQKRIATIINSIQDIHPQGFKEDLKNAILHEQGEYIQGSSSEFRRKQARSAGHFLGELYTLSRTSSTEFKASVQSVITLTLKDWIKAPKVTTINEDTKLLLEVYSECLEEFLILTLRDNDESLKKQVSTLLKEEMLSTTKPKEAKALLVDTLFKLACQRCTVGILLEEQKRQQSSEKNSALSEPPLAKGMPSTPPQLKAQNDGMQPNQYRQQHQNQPLPGSKFMSPPPSGLAQVPGRLPPGPHQMNFQQAGPVNMNVPPPTMSIPPPNLSVPPPASMSQPGQDIPLWPVASQGPPMQGSIPAAATSTGMALQNQLPQQLQQQQQLGYLNQSIPASMQTPQGSVPIPQTQDGTQRHSHGIGATIQMLQQGVVPDSQSMVPQASGIPLSQATSMSSMMHSSHPQMLSGVPAQQMGQPGMQFTSAGTTVGHPAQSSSQFFRNLPMSLAQQMSTSMNYQQQEELANQMGRMVLSGSDPWQHSGVGVTQAVTAPIFSTAQGANPSVPQGNPSVQSSQGDFPGHPSFAQSAVSGRFVQNSMLEAAPKQGFQQNSDDARQGLGQWGMSSQGPAWSDKLSDSTQLPSNSPPSFTSPNQTLTQWPVDGRSMKSPEAMTDTPPQEPSGWGDASPGPQESSQQRLGTDGWGSSNPSQSVANWGAEPQPNDSWNGHVKSFPAQQPGTVQQNSAEHSETGPRGFANQSRMPNQTSGPSNVVKAPSKDKYVFEESASSGGGFQRPNAYTLPSKHKDGSPAAEGVSYNAMSELGSYGIDPGNSYDSSTYGGGYTTIRDGGGYGDSLPPGGQKIGNFVLLPENKPLQNSNSPEHFEISAIRDCFLDEDDLSSYELNAYQNQLRHRKEHGRPNWSQFETSKEKQKPSALSAGGPRENNRRGHGRGTLVVTNPCTAMPPFPATHPPGSRQPPIKQKYPPRN